MAWQNALHVHPAENSTQAMFDLEELNRNLSRETFECLDNSWRNSNKTLNDGMTCEPVWDNIYCWPETPGGTLVAELCSVAFSRSHPFYAPHLEGNATRFCLQNGTWLDGVRTNYEECALSYEAYERKQQEEKYIISIVQQILFIGSLLSLFCLAIAITIFRCFRILQCDRVALLMHLMIALSLRFTLLVIITEPFVFERSNNYRNVDTICKLVILLHLYATVACVSWMLIQGFYLNSKLTSSLFNRQSRRNFALYFSVGWVVPAILVGIYTSAMLVNRSGMAEKCWKGYAEMAEIWILLGPMLVALVFNMYFLVNILRILLGNVRRRATLNDESAQLRAAAKATLVLSPVLGVNNLLLVYNPGGEYEKYYVIINAVFGATQGISVSVVYCFLNKEVQESIRRLYDRKVAQWRWANSEADKETAHQSEMHPIRGGVTQGQADVTETFV